MVYTEAPGFALNQLLHRLMATQLQHSLERVANTPAGSPVPVTEAPGYSFQVTLHVPTGATTTDIADIPRAAKWLCEIANLGQDTGKAVVKVHAPSQS